MNRVIKFRAWLKCINKMTYPGTIEDITKWAPFGCEPIWMQYIGLKDKKSKEIYEGDIVEAHGYKDVIIFKAPSFGVQNKEQDVFVTYSTSWDIIGNIYETPHLLNNEQGAPVSDTTKA